MDDIDELYYLFPDIKEHIKVEKKVGQVLSISPSRTKQEIECLLNIGGQENVIGVHAVLRNKSHILIIMPYVHHAPFNDSFASWSLAEVRDYIRSLLIALNRVHQCGIIHRDVKPSNFLYDSSKKIYALVDFGLAQNYDKKDEFDIFNEKFVPNKKRLSNIQNENQPKHNFISMKKPSLMSPRAPKSPRASYSPVSSSQSHLVSVHKQTKHAANTCNSLSEEITKRTPIYSMTNQLNTKLASSLANNQNKASFISSQSYESNLSGILNSTDNNAPDEEASIQKLSSPQSISKSSMSDVTSTTPTTTETKAALMTKTTTMTTTTTNKTTSTAIMQNSSHMTSNRANVTSSVVSSTTTATRTATTTASTTRTSTTPHLQKYYSFQKPSFGFSDNRCSCFNMPFVCEICTARSSKWAPRAGTAGFRAPEVLFRSNHQTPAVDIWSAGVIFLSLLTGRYPFFKAVDDNMAIMQLIALFGYEPVRKAASKRLAIMLK